MLTELLNEFKDRLPSEDIKNILEFIENNEFGLAFETLCTQIYEYNIQIPFELYDKISSLGQANKIPPAIWTPLKVLITCRVPIKISLNEIKQAFDFIIHEKKSREEISNWALKLLFAHDDNFLDFDPRHEERRIWAGILYLTGVDLKTSPNTYLHGIEDFIEYIKKL